MAKVNIDEAAVDEVLSRAVEQVLPSREELKKLLLSGKRIKLYLGIDPTGPHIHLGHATNLLTLRRFQELGHEVILLIGDFTARIGDPDKSAARTQLTEKEVKANLKTFKQQAEKILRFSGKNAAKIEFNAKWLSKLKFEDIINIASKFTVQQMIERDLFERRLNSDSPLHLHEFFYPLMQGYDSVALNVDLEIGGTDQTFNMLAGRKLMKALLQKEKFVLTTRLLVNPKTGTKLMNKSEGGLVNLDDSPKDLFGKIMALSDEGILPLAEFSTLMPMERVEALREMLSKGGNPRDAKLEVGHSVVEMMYGKKTADSARKEFLDIFSKKEINAEDMPAIKAPRDITVLDLVMLSGVVSSKSEARRMIEQGGVKIDDRSMEDPMSMAAAAEGSILKVGKRHFFRVEV